MKYRNYLTATTLTVLLHFAAGLFSARAAETMPPDYSRPPAPESMPAGGQSQEPRSSPPREYADGYLAQRLGAAQKAGELPGMVVRDRKGHRLGKIEDLLLSLGNGRVVGAVIRPGGIFRHAQYTLAIPAKCFFMIYNGEAVLNLDKSSLTNAPRFIITGNDAAALSRLLAESYAHFNKKIFWNPAAGPGPICESSGIMGMEIRNKAGEDLGQVVNLMVDLPTGRLIFVVASLDGSTGSLYVMPPEVLAVNPQGNDILLDQDRTKIAARARQSGFFWDDAVSPAWAAASYRSYGLEPDFATASGGAGPKATREYVRERIDTPANITTGRTDAEITQTVLTALIRDGVANVYIYRNMRIQTEAGRVTLSGQVKTEQQREEVGASVASVVGPENLANGLTIKK